MVVGFELQFFCRIYQATRYPLSLLPISHSTIVVIARFNSSVDRKCLPASRLLRSDHCHGAAQADHRVFDHGRAEIGGKRDVGVARLVQAVQHGYPSVNQDVIESDRLHALCPLNTHAACSTNLLLSESGATVIRTCPSCPR